MILAAHQFAASVARTRHLTGATSVHVLRLLSGPCSLSDADQLRIVREVLATKTEAAAKKASAA